MKAQAYVAVFSLTVATTLLARRAPAADPPPSLDLECERVHDVVYVESNDYRPGLNSILGYRRHVDGSLTPLAGSPFYTGGTGYNDPNLVLDPAASDQNIIVNPQHTLLFAVNSGIGNSVAVFHIEPEGNLVPAHGSPFPSGGVNPSSLGLLGDRLVVVNKNQDPAQNSADSLPNYAVFHVDHDGALSPIPGAILAVPQGASPSQALVTPNGRFVYDAWVLGGEIYGVDLLHSGELQAIAGFPQALPDKDLPFGLMVNPRAPALYVGEADLSHVTVYRYDENTGAVSLVEQATTTGVAPCWFAINDAGTHLYSVNLDDNSLTRWSVADAFHPVQEQRLELAPAGFILQTALDPTEHFEYVVSQRFKPDGDASDNALHIVRISDAGVMSEAPFSPMPLPVPLEAHPQGVVVL